MRIVAIANQKGGVGKTTTSVNLGACVAGAGARVLVLDLDPQANATSALGYSPDESSSIYQPLLGEGRIDDLVLETRYPNLSLIPANMDLAGSEIELARQDDHLVRLRALLADFGSRAPFDYLFLDCPPSLGVLMTSALAAADELIIPLQCEFFGMEGLSKISFVVSQICESGANPDLVIEGVIMTMADSRTNLSQQVIEEVRRHFGEKVYQTVVPRSIRLGEAPSFGQAIVDYAPNSKGANAYRGLAQEFLARHGQPAVEPLH